MILRMYRSSVHAVTFFFSSFAFDFLFFKLNPAFSAFVLAFSALVPASFVFVPEFPVFSSYVFSKSLRAPSCFSLSFCLL